MENKIIPIDRCHTVSPNNDDFQEINVIAVLNNGSEVHLIFTPEDWLDTFTPTMYEHVKKEYIKYIQDKK